MLAFNTPITDIIRLGAAAAKRLAKLGINTAGDLLFYFPFRYDDFRAVTPISGLAAGMNANIVGRIELIRNKRSPRKRMHITEALVADETDTIRVVWFNQPFIAKSLKAGDTVSLAGKIEGSNGDAFMRSPVYEKADGGALHTHGLVPNYHLTAGLTQKQIRFFVSQVITLADSLADWLPAGIIASQKLIPLNKAVRKIHFPADFADAEAARARLAFDELFLLQIQSQLARRELDLSRTVPIKFQEKETKKFVDSLSFRLTDDQRKAAWEILRDMEKERPMTRLVEGDVGSGKTLVAVIAMLNAALNKKQSVLMVPTEILAKQHYDSVCKLLSDDISVVLLTRSQFSIFNFKFSNNDKITKNKIIQTIKDGDAKIIIGTHALLQENVVFNNLALAIIDEQHRFGVEQRQSLIKKSSSSQVATEKTIHHEKKPALGNVKCQLSNVNCQMSTPHLLSMTATPIPRSLALALYGDLDLSIIREMPAGRKKIITQVVSEAKRQDAYGFMRKQIEAGRQVFVICPLIDISDSLGVKSAKQEFEKLDKVVFPDLPIGILHGRMKAKEKEAVMSGFLEKKIKILVSTSVVEVGVDVPNATIMMIEGADRFGLAQLHQFRGRVGRGEHQSYCFLFSDNGAERTVRRLNAMTENHDGFTLAKIDLKFRGPGEIYGTAQKGFPELSVATLFDYDLMKRARDEAVKIIAADTALDSWPRLKEKVSDLVKKTRLE